MLTIVPTPLGNLEDITVRALRALRACDVVLCEDTRRTVKLLNRYSISKKLQRYNELDERSVSEAAALLREGKNAVLVSDGGTPCISDPGRKLVALARAEGLTVTSLPGPSAVTAAAAGSGLPSDSFVFLGFLPRQRGKALKALKKALELEKTVILYESPFRIKDLMDLVCSELGGGLRAVIVRELSKVYEEWYTGTAAGVRDALAGAREIKGEIAVLLSPAGAGEDRDRARSGRKTVVFVCTGNTCRSALAQHYAAKAAGDASPLRFVSAGLAADSSVPVPAHVLALLGGEGIPDPGHIPSPLTAALAGDSDLILTMTRAQKAAVLERFPAAFDKTFTLTEYADQGGGDIPDPFGGDAEVYAETFRHIRKAVDAIVGKLSGK